MAATSKGEMSVPTKYVKDLCESLYTTWSVSEYNTSTACTECGAQLVPVYQLHNQNVFQTRGLKYCNSSECKGCPLKHRENVGAINISTMFLFEVYGVPLPVLLDRYHPVQASKLKTKRLANQYHLRAPHSSIGKNAKKKALDKIMYDRRARARGRHSKKVLKRKKYDGRSRARARRQEEQE